MANFERYVNEAYKSYFLDEFLKRIEAIKDLRWKENQRKFRFTDRHDKEFYSTEGLRLVVERDNEYILEVGEEDKELLLYNMDKTPVRLDMNSHYQRVGMSLDGESFGYEAPPAEKFDGFVSLFNQTWHSFEIEGFVQPIKNSRIFRIALYNILEEGLVKEQGIQNTKVAGLAQQLKLNL